MTRLSLLPLALLLYACVPAPGNPAPGGVVQGAGPDDLASARERWEAADIDDYSFTVRRSCFCPPEYTGPHRVTVRDGRVTGVTYEGRPVDAEQLQTPTVTSLFEQLAEAYRSGAAEVRASYDARTGHPVEIWIDQEREMADEEIGYTLSDLAAD